ncbi:MAG TPA: hypothetical protein EYH30_01215 [Anaerolineales bacterium]|nr:hypothetical protein [Anaerolineae bacterium]HIQ00745.1 hypothetical protein [Anaerolineales bacterium]
MGDRPLPKFLRPLFWDTNFDRLRIPGHERYIIERVLEYGDVAEVRWMMQCFPREQIVETLRRSRGLSRKSARFWSLVLDVPPEQMRCLTASSRQQPGRIWPW